MSKVIIIAGSIKDDWFVSLIEKNLTNLDIKSEKYYLSAHKETLKLVSLVKEYDSQNRIIFVTVAGKSNALSGVVSCNTKHVVIACPPFNSVEEYSVDIHSTLRMPSNCPVSTVISPENCALIVDRIFKMGS